MFPESDVDNSTIAPQDNDVRQSGRVLEFQNRDLRIQPTDLSWHFTINATLREEPFKNYRAKSSAKLKTKEDKIEEAKKQKTQRSEEDEWSPAEWQPSSLSWQQRTTRTSSSSSAWRGWSSDQTRERSGLRSSGSWKSPFKWLNENLIYKDIYKGIHDDESNVCL